MAGPVKHNLKNPAVKRILQEMKEMQNNPSDDYVSLPLEDNIFEWQFAIRGPRDTEFEGGIYHGRIQLPPEYPFKPPAFMLLTPNGRFETQTKICLSISQYHPEFWQPSWSVRTALVALIAFMPTKPNGAIGSLEFSKEERQALAIKSCAAAPKFGNEERQKVIDEIHEQMLKKTPMQKGATAAEASHDCASSIVEGGITEHSALEGNFKHEQEDIEVHGDSSGSNTNVDPVTGVLVEGTVAAMEEHDVTTPTPETRAFAGAVSSESIQNVRSELSVPVTRHQSSDDRWLTLLAIALTVALAALLIKKLWNSYRWIGI